MSILTKIFVVLTTVMAVLLAALIVPYVKNTDHYKAQLEGEQALRAAAEQSARTAGAALKQVQEELGRTIERLEQDKNVLATRISGELEPDLKRLNDEIRRLNDDLDVKDGQIDLVSAGTKQQAEIIRVVQGQLTTAQTDFLNVSRRLTELNDQLQDRTASLETAKEQIRQISETAQDLANQLEAAKQQAAAPGADAAGRTVVADRPIRGTVTEVQSVDGQTFCSISVGKNDGVANGMVFLVHDGDNNLLGELTITNADLNISAGRVTLQKGQISENNEVLTADF